MQFFENINIKEARINFLKKFKLFSFNIFPHLSKVSTNIPVHIYESNY
jgi:hypothetical protein